MKKILVLGGVALLLQMGGCRLHAPSTHAHSSGRIAAGDSSSHAAADSTSHSAADSSAHAAADSTATEKASVLPMPDLGYNAREGRVLYRHYCLFCHGDAGAGDGFNAYNLDPHPQSLADSAFQARHTDDDLAAAIRSGGGAVGLSTGMPPWGRTLNERKIHNLVTYVRTLRAKSAGAR